MLYHTIGFGLLTSWLWMLFLQGPLLENVASLWSVSSLTLFLLFLIAQAVAGFSISRWFKLRQLLTDKAALQFATVFLLVLDILVLSEPFLYPAFFRQSPLLPIACASLSGFTSAPLFIVWMESFGSFPLTKAAEGLASSLCLAAFLTALAMFLPLTLNSILLNLCLLGSWYFYSKSKQFSTVKPTGTIALPIRYFLSTRLIVLVSLLYVAGGSIFGTLSIAPEVPSFYYISNFAYAIACLFSIFLLKHSLVPDLHSLFRPILPFMGLGFLLFPLLPISVAWFALSLVQIGVAFLDMYTWLLFSTLARSHTHPIAVCAFGIGLMTLFIVCGNILSLILSSLFANISVLNIICLLSGTICLVSTQLFFTNWLPPGVEISLFKQPPLHSAPFPEELETPALPEENTEKLQPVVLSVEEIRDCYKSGDFSIYLTPREKQVLFLLARSYNNKAIADKLFITNNTVKYHIKNIYQKFNVTSRQALIELLFGKNTTL